MDFEAVTTSPAYLFNQDAILDNLKPLESLREATGCKIIYSIKALPLLTVLELLNGRVDGFSVSSLFEARLAREVLGEQGGSVHLTTPGLRTDEFAEIRQLCSHISFNSLSQQARLHNPIQQDYSAGLRVNPKLSYVDDDRYNPCRQYSKLGVDWRLLQQVLPPSIEGLHFHTVFSREDFVPVLATVEKILPLLKQHDLKWLNLGGGYLYNCIDDQQAFINLIKVLTISFGVEVYLEPGKAIVGNAGYLLTTVVDKFVSDGKTILVLDSSVNHHPEVFEYQRQPSLYAVESGQERAILAGSSCLAGDIFGEYAFDNLPNVGERLVFDNLGAYSLIKANRFNGYNLPDVYYYQQGRFELYKHYSYQDYHQQWCPD
jgi:carboxynorspermidine decarboxylase